MSPVPFVFILLVAVLLIESGPKLLTSSTVIKPHKPNVYLVNGHCNPIICEAVQHYSFNHVQSINEADIALLDVHRMSCEEIHSVINSQSSNKHQPISNSAAIINSDSNNNSNSSSISSINNNNISSKRRAALVALDWADSCRLKCGPLHDMQWYFKRSLVDKSQGLPQPFVYPQPVMHLHYAVKSSFAREMDLALKKTTYSNSNSNSNSNHNDYSNNSENNSSSNSYSSRKYDICSFFGVYSNNEDKRDFRKEVPLTLFNLSKSSQYSHLRFSLDILGEKGDFGRWNVSGAYVSRLSSCKLVVTANPRHWEGDFRLMESLSSGALVFVDSMLYLPYGLRDGHELVFYEDMADMINKIDYYLAHPSIGLAVAARGQFEALTNHQPHHLLNHIIQTVMLT